MSGLSGQSIAHDSAARHGRGDAVYVDDMPEPPGLLHAAVRLSDHAHARILRIDTTAVLASPGVVAAMTAADIPGVNDVGPAFPGDPVLADKLIEYHGQALLAVAAGSVVQARRAVARAVVMSEILPPVLTIEEALAARSFVLPSRLMRRGDPAGSIQRSQHRLQGTLRVGGQDHFYLEGQIAMAIPGEHAMRVFSSTQHPSEVQHMVARALGWAEADVACETRRIGGGFGGKESQASQVAVIAALLAERTGRPVKLRLDRDADMTMTGKRHDFRIDYDVGFNDAGRIEGLSITLSARCGFSPDLSGAVADRAMLHADNCYFLENVEVISHRLKTNTVSATAFRGFGGPQGMMGIEAVVDAVARRLRLDPLVVRLRNLYGMAERNTTPYGMKVEDNVAPLLIARLSESSDYSARRRSLAAFNDANTYRKRGLALTPVKFGIAFTRQEMNQAGALLHIYTDGSVLLNHGGVEMGQGLHVKVCQVIADEFGLPLDRVRVSATATDKVPNTSPTAASSGADLNARAAQLAARRLKRRIATVLAPVFGCAETAIEFAAGCVRGGGRSVGFAEAARQTKAARVSLSATGFYRTPKIHFDAETQTGRPFLYFAYGAAVSEVEIDTLTGEYRVLRADILHDCGRSLNPAIDRGQIEGGFVQGMGWLTGEELVWNDTGELRTHAPSTYKIPTARDVPADFRVAIFENENTEPVVYRSKAVGEPPLMLAISVFHALRDAVSACGEGEAAALDSPATPERVLMAVDEIRARRRARRPFMAVPAG